MPRATAPRAKIHVKRTPPVLLTHRVRPQDGNGPRLWNAKRRIKTSRGLPFLRAHALVSKEKLQEWQRTSWNKLNTEEQKAFAPIFREDGLNTEWWKLDRKNLERFMETHPSLREVSSDVKSFIAAGSINFEKSTILRILMDPARYFALPHNVPLSMRRQVYFPDPKDAVVLMRTPHLGPRYAAFDVPLHFNKIDLRAYLKDVYGVDVLHIRSVVLQQKVERKDGRSKYSQGKLFRPPSKKKMTCLLAKPFVYPAEPEDLEPWEHDRYWESMKAIVEKNREESEWGMMNPDLKHRKAMALQAQQLLKGKMRWAPTWQNFADDWRAMRGLGANASNQQPSQPANPSS
ncbi:hypothetical protein AYO20_03178 [Fonsecaea nubica]|uniref:Large ribosomal subunit protein uL23m n=1 Tax=Fonsecaea nubica TaxID=856822 RepID=A0A178D8X9_9EURO|nr:hypothetical protein AYO20_03178 [Fonsecaea nubica]OAL37671.1 hypothetical protein AYO20_03178 [Fonsecaea nubica]